MDGSVDYVFCCLVDLWNDSFWYVSVSLEIVISGTCCDNDLNYCIPHIHGNVQGISLAGASVHNFHKIVYVFLFCVSQHQLLYHCWRSTLILIMSVME